VRWPEDEEHPHPVKAAFMIFGQLFALFCRALGFSSARADL
jgi:hypothetical protein